MINNAQHAIRSSRSCYTILLDSKMALECWMMINVLMRSSSSSSRAFEIVYHKRLISKIYAYNVNGKCIDWIVNW